MNGAVVVGSLNMDLVFRAARMPHAGETMFGHGFAMAEGGKGANQAVAAARLGARVAMVGRIGADAFGTQLRASLVRDRIDVTHISVSEDAPTGVAMILVEPAGENRIVLAPGANLALTPADIDAASGLLAQARVLVLQLEVPVPTVAHAVARAVQAGVPVLLNPAPAADLPDDLWPAIDYLVPNETEAALLTGTTVSDGRSAAAAAQLLLGRGVRHVLITLGAQGVLVANAAGERLLPARKVKAIDTTAAGDSFIGAFVAGLCSGMTLDQSAQFGIVAASHCVTREGAQNALPYLSDLSGA